MSIASKVLNKQKRVYFSYIWRGIALMGIGIFAGVMILRTGIGNAPKNERSAGAKIYKLLSSLMEQSETAEKLVPICFAGFFFVIAAIGLYNLIRGGWLIIPAHTMLGKSILLQAKDHEGFREMMDSINADMAKEPYTFGAVYIGREWILDAEAMRLSRIKGVFCIDAGKEDYALCCVDEAQNIWASGFTGQKDRDKAVAHLMKILPDIITGGREEYIAFLKTTEVQEQKV